MSRLFTENEKEFLRENYLKIPIKEMARILGRSSSATFRNCKKLGLHLPPDVLRARRIAQLSKGCGWNKGMKQSEFMSPEAIERTKSTRFKKGILPHNTRSDGDLSIRSDGYVYIRTTISKWELLHRVIYEDYHQVNLQREDNIVFKDGNRNNFDIDNLILKTNAEMIEQNSIHNYPEDLKSAIRALSNLKRKIKTHAKQN